MAKEHGAMEGRLRACFEGLADFHRLKMIDLLLEGEMSVTALCAHFTMRQPSVSHHLAVLKKGGIVKTRRNGKEILYSVNRKYLSSVMTYYFARFGFMVKEMDAAGPAPGETP
ncbi:MAG: ArsR family transcriptional regulator [Candidatus Nitrosotenuis sp.]|nr:MAG: ArsR family transcriptional regulator [Candidatus Nitrosotenuis sp.]